MKILNLAFQHGEYVYVKAFNRRLRARQKTYFEK